MPPPEVLPPALPSPIAPPRQLDPRVVAFGVLAGAALWVFGYSANKAQKAKAAAAAAAADAERLAGPPATPQPASPELPTPEPGGAP